MVRTDILEQAMAIRGAMKISARYLPDEIAVEQPSGFYETWTVGEAYEANDKVMHNGQLYNVEQPITAMEHQPPDGEGMLAIYRPINRANAGTLEDPIPWVYGMDCTTGNYYSYNGVTYRCEGDMKPCVWTPDSGIWQWVIAE